MPWSQRLNRLHCKRNISAFQVLPPLPCLLSWHSEKIHTPSIWLLLQPEYLHCCPEQTGLVAACRAWAPLIQLNFLVQELHLAQVGLDWKDQSLSWKMKSKQIFKGKKKKKKGFISNWKLNINRSAKLCQLSDKYTAICWAVSGSFSHLKVLIQHKNVALPKTTLSWELNFSVRQCFP